jgi:hypothetical protein
MTSIYSTIARVFSGANHMSTGPSVSSLQGITAVVLSSSADQLNNSCWLQAIRIPT